MLRRVIRRLKDEAGDSMTMLLITALPFLILIVGWAVDINKNATVKSEYNDIAQESVQAAVRAQDGTGGLLCGGSGSTTLQGVSAAKSYASNTKNPSARRLAVSTYLQKTGRMANTIYTDNNGSAASNDAKFTSTMRQYGYGADGSSSQEEDDFSITVTCSAGISSGVGSANSSGTVGGGNSINVIELQVNDWSSNFILGMFNGLFGDNVNMNIQKYSIDERAISSWSSSSVN
jgi:hypothetical protein